MEIPQSNEACFVRLFDNVEYLAEKITTMGVQVDNIENRLSSIELKMTHQEGEQCGAKQVKTSMGPYILTFTSVLLATIATSLLYYLGFK
jgi:hypothetical protein